MAVRPIDGTWSKFVWNLSESESLARKFRDGKACLIDLRLAVEAQPTLTQPNETPPCYQPDGDGCAYQCYDGDDEPIDKCKECPLCYSDKQRHHAPPNGPLTLEELREMDGEPVYLIVDDGYEPLEMWALIDVPEEDHIVLINNIGGRSAYYSDDGLKQDHITVYRRPPEGEADA